MARPALCRERSAGSARGTAARKVPEGARTRVRALPNTTPRSSALQSAAWWPRVMASVMRTKASPRARLLALLQTEVPNSPPEPIESAAVRAQARAGNASVPEKSNTSVTSNTRVTKYRIQCQAKTGRIIPLFVVTKRIRCAPLTPSSRKFKASALGSPQGSEGVFTGRRRTQADGPPANQQPSAVIFAMQSTVAEANRLLSVREAASRLGVCRRTLEREVCRKKFPPPVKIAGKSCYFVSDVDAYVAKARERRDAFG